MQIDVQALGCDFLSATGRKFLRGPRGTGFLYVAEKWLPTLEPAMIDHFGAPWIARDQYTLRDDARRFETWENSYALRAGLGAAVDYADALGMEVIETRIAELGAYCRDAISALPNVQVLDLGTQQCGIVSFAADGIDGHELARQMAQAGFAIGASEMESTRLDSERRGLGTILRMVPHYYNTRAEITSAVEALDRLT